MQELLKIYKEILSNIKFDIFDLTSDKYSGVFLPIAFEQYWNSNVKIMLVGRETAGWNTNNTKNTITRIKNHFQQNMMEELILEATNRHANHIVFDKNKKIKDKTKSHFKRYFFQLSKEFNLDPRAIIYSNFFAWDYNKKSVFNRPKAEVDEITAISIQLLSAQIEYFKPDFIIFASGLEIDNQIKVLMNQNMGGYDTLELVINRFWKFKSKLSEHNTVFFRIAHPRSIRSKHGDNHSDYRTKVIEQIKEYTTLSD